MTRLAYLLSGAKREEITSIIDVGLKAKKNCPAFQMDREGWQIAGVDDV